jgi:hypothetical protein
MADEFGGFSSPEDANFTRIPNDWFDICAKIKNLAELKIVLYLIRHTWGFHEYDKFKRISIDEFAHGRKHKGGKRMDDGTGLGLTAVKDGIRRAKEHGYIVTTYDRSDLGRIKKYYTLRMKGYTYAEEEEGD